MNFRRKKRLLEVENRLLRKKLWDLGRWPRSPPFRTLSYKRFSLLLPLSCSGTGHSIKVVFKSCWNLSRAIVSLIARQDSKYRQCHQLQLDMGTKTSTKNKFCNKAEEKSNLCDTLPDTWFGKRWLCSKTQVYTLKPSPNFANYRIPRSFVYRGCSRLIKQ